MARTHRSQVTVELAPKVKEELERLTEEGSILSVQDFVRRAVENELGRWRADHSTAPALEQTSLMVPTRKAR
jgi:Arc/MetJ-type ribon-helix-helix transcriptional regulator